MTEVYASAASSSGMRSRHRGAVGATLARQGGGSRARHPGGVVGAFPGRSGARAPTVARTHALARRGTVRGPDATLPRWTPPFIVRLVAQARGLRRGFRAVDARTAVDPTPGHRRSFSRGAVRPALESDLHRLVGRLRLQDAVAAAPRALVRAAAVALAAIGIGRAAELDMIGWAVAFGAGLWASIILVRTLVRRIGPFEAARRADSHLGLRAQLATALELLDVGAEGDLVAMQVAGASGAARAIVPGAALPVIPADPRWRRDASVRLGAAFAALAAAAVIVAWPEPPRG